MSVSSGKNGNASAKRRVTIIRRLGSLLRAIDVWRLLISVILAVCAYIVISNYSDNGKYSVWRRLEVPVEIHTEDGDGRIYLQEQTYSVEVEFSVDILHCNKVFMPEDFGIKIDLNRLQASMGDFSPSNKNVEPLRIPYKIAVTDVYRKPVGVSIRNINKGHADINIICDRILGRQLSVVVNVDRSRQLPSWTYECVPKTPVVTVSGPAFEVNKLEKIQCDISPEGRQQYTEAVALRVPHTVGCELLLDPSSIECSVTPKRDSYEEVERVFNNLRVFFLNRLDCQLHPKVRGGEEAMNVNVYLRGLGKILDAVSTEQLRVVCDLTPYTLAGGQHVKLMVMGLPDGVSVERITPQDALEVELVHEESPAPQNEKAAPAEEVKANE
ncbi:MAG: hypothetical protein MJ106_06830 [Lentisphaeria bacterium]|nr:hypothetical protein [Lentisphaeria bacterium]